MDQKILEEPPVVEEELPHDPERDPQILEITNSLCQQLGITNYHPTFVSWEVYAQQNRPNANRRAFPLDDCLLERHCVTLSGWMRGRLEPDEWKPIIASSLIFSKTFRRRTSYGYLLPSTLFVIFAILVMAELPGIGGSIGSALGGLVFAGILIGILIGTVLAGRVRTLADEKTADLVGEGAFLSTLRKIAELAGPEWKRGRWGLARPFPLLPSLSKRIARLEKYSQMVQRSESDAVS